MNPILIQLKELEYGVNIKLENIEKKIKFFCIAGVFDKPAKAMMLNMINSTGHGGCTKCLQLGETYSKDADGNFKIITQRLSFKLN